MNLSSLLSTLGGGSVNLNTLKNILTSSQQTRQTMDPQTSVESVALLTLLFETLYNLLLSKGAITSEEFTAKFNELDLQDGVKDGKLRK